MLRQFNFPDVGEGLTEGEILKWHVRPGDTVTDGQMIVEVETAKAAVELPCPFDGVVTELHVGEGATVDVGAPILTVDVESAAPAPDLTSDLVPPARPGLQEPELLVGSGVKVTRTARRPRRPGPPPGAVHGSSGAAPDGAGPVAKPPVRKFAKDRGIDLSTVTGSGPGGRITRADVEAAGAAPAAAADEQRVAGRGVRKQTARAMVASALTAPHVTEFLTIDITASLQLRDRLAARPEFAGLTVSPLLLVAKALLIAVRRHPMVNSSWDEQAQEIVVKRVVNLGVAAATDRGLIVPNIKDAGAMGLPALAGALTDLVQTARCGRTSPADLSGGTITISNVGVFGVDTGTPILPPGESAILAVGAIRELPWVVDGQVVPRRVCQLAVSFDHRIIDGQLGAEFLADIGAILTDPGLALVLG